MKSSALATTALNSQPGCDQSSCIIFYRSDYCFFCDAAHEILSDTLTQFGMSKDSVTEIDVGQNEESVYEREILGLPTITICQEKILGLPDKGVVRDALMKAMLRDCFRE
ncbi:hypothetical protein EU537_07550 [Candidatus Thorarchaeota archaeon]|nr:MAG: hypothetical protein EU537_07550 [Candidatus Thorarchaeota archaeon]